MVVRALARTSVSAHRPTLALNAQGKKDWELEKIQHQMHKQFSTQAIVTEAECIGSSPLVKQPRLKPIVT